MNNDLAQFSEDMLGKMAAGDILPTVLEQAALARIALAAKQDKPVEVLQFIINNPEKDGYIEWADCNQDYFNSISIDHRRVLYTTPPANSPAIPDGWKMVPVDPTIEMLTNGVISGVNASPDPWCPHVWAAMLAAAPKPESE